MAWFACLGGGGAVEPQFSKTKIVDNTLMATSFDFDEDYHDYDFLEITYKNTSTSATEVVWVTPEMVDVSLDIATKFTVNFYNTDIYATYVETVSNGTITWSIDGTHYRTCAIIEINGVSCTNCSVSKTEFYTASASGSSSVTITTQDSIFANDCLMILTNSSDKTEVVPCNTIYPINNSISDEIRLPLNGYKTSNRVVVVVTDTSMSSFPYGYVVGIKFA